MYRYNTNIATWGKYTNNWLTIYTGTRGFKVKCSARHITSDLITALKGIRTMDLLISILLDKITEAINTNVSDSPTRATDAY